MRQRREGRQMTEYRLFDAHEAHFVKSRVCLLLERIVLSTTFKKTSRDLLLS